MRHEIKEALVRQFHAEMGTFHLSCGEYAILFLDWVAILGIRLGGFSISTDEMSFKMASELLGIPFPLTADMKGYYGPTRFEDFLRIPRYTTRHKIGEALVWQFHAEMGTFHLSCEEYAILPLDWAAIWWLADFD